MVNALDATGVTHIHNDFGEYFVALSHAHKYSLTDMFVTISSAGEWANGTFYGKNHQLTISNVQRF